MEADQNLDQRNIRRVICIGDLHGNLKETFQLWQSLEQEVGVQELSRSTIVFLGDYCDRGPDTKGIMEWLCTLQQKRQQEDDTGGTHFIAGNHDFGFAAYLGILPTDDPPSPEYLDSTTPPQFTSGFWVHHVPEGMSYQGRRWGGSYIYDADTTFESYGVRFDPNAFECREALQNVVPQHHKEFLQSLKWVHEQDLEFPPAKLICTHAGLLSNKATEPQLIGLRSRDYKWSEILSDSGAGDRFAAFWDRETVIGMPADLVGKAIFVSGHHGTFRAENDRYIIDASGGNPSSDRPIQALILPDRKIVNHTALN